MTNLYRVVFTGRLRKGFSAEQAARDFASVFKVSEEKACAWVPLARRGGVRRSDRGVDGSQVSM